MPERIQLQRRPGGQSSANTYEVLMCRMCEKPGQKGQQGFCSPECRFWSNVEKTDTCWLWTARPHSSKGYGRFDALGRRWLAHRYAYTLIIGEFPDELELDHTCRNTRCVNPAHLDPVTSEVHDNERSDPGGYNRAKTKCPRGHQYTAENTRFNGNHRHCRRCDIELGRRRRAATHSTT